MDCLTDDALIYLIDIILDNFDCSVLSSFLVCNKIKSLSDMVINNKLKTNYKILIRNNYLINPFLAYNNIYNIYKGKFVICNYKLTKLILLCINNNNTELLKIISKTIPIHIKSSKEQLEIPWHKKEKYIEFIKFLENNPCFYYRDSDKLYSNHHNIITYYENYVESVC